jgi:LemA protein
MEVGLIILVILVVAAGYGVAVYNSLQSLLTEIEASIQEIGNQLKRQASLIPNLETSAKAYLKQEKEIFGLLTDARKSVTAAEGNASAENVAKVESQLQAILPKLQVMVESNPEIKSNETIQQFMAELRDTADKLTYARRAVIDLAQQFNQKLVVFPSNLIANMFGFKKQAGLATPLSGAHVSVSEAETQDVQVKL